MKIPVFSIGDKLRLLLTLVWFVIEGSAMLQLNTNEKKDAFFYYPSLWAPWILSSWIPG